MTEHTTTMSAKGQVVIPAALRKDLGLEEGTQFVVQKGLNGSVVFSKVPGLSDIDKLLAIVPIPDEDVDIDENGHYDPVKSPDFDQWMREG